MFRSHLTNYARKQIQLRAIIGKTPVLAMPLTGQARNEKEISDELLDKLGTLSTQALIDGLWVMGWPTAHIMGARPLSEGQKKACGRAITVQFVPQRPDIMKDKPPGMESPEYEAFEMAGPREVVVMNSVGPWESVGGDIKFLRLMQKKVAGLVTDGSVRDTAVLRGYGFPVFSISTTPRQGPHVHQPWACNHVINCGGVTVRPGDAIVGDQDGVVVVPAAVAQEVYDIAHSREIVEDVVKKELEQNPGPPGRYYPFHSKMIKAESPLGKLLTSKGITPVGGFMKSSYSTQARGGGQYNNNNNQRTTNTRGINKNTAMFQRNMSSYMKSQSDYDEVLQTILKHKATAVLRTMHEGKAELAMDAAVRGGFKLAEFTMTTPGWEDAVSNFAKRTDVLTGVGTCLTVADAKRAMDVGSRFIVSPVLIPAIVTWCKENNIVCMPGCQTPTELHYAYTLGAPIQKLFPGVAGGPAWVKAVSSALPHLRINPTSGTDLGTCQDYLRNGASSLGFVAPAFDQQRIKDGDWDYIVRTATALTDAVKAA
jgi:Entner-Doudoroff aldolase